jgi:hypothetical protein
VAAFGANQSDLLRSLLTLRGLGVSGPALPPVASPERGVQIRGVLDRRVIPWFGPQTTCVGDTYFMLHERVLTLGGRRPSGAEGDPGKSAGTVGVGLSRELSQREAARGGSVLNFPHSSGQLWAT